MAVKAGQFGMSLLCLWLVGGLATGCKKKKPVTAPEAAPPPVLQEMAPPPEPMPSPEPPPTDEPDPLEGDLASVNAHLRQQGVLDDVYFQYDQSDLSEEGRQALARTAGFLRSNPRFRLTVEGHCDERGTNEYNLSLGERRAQAVRSYLASLGVPAEALMSISYGEEKPACSTSEESCWSQNRRAHLVITGRSAG